jgi:hypothetical protein
LQSIKKEEEERLFFLRVLKLKCECLLPRAAKVHLLRFSSKFELCAKDWKTSRFFSTWSLGNVARLHRNEQGEQIGQSFAYRVTLYFG